MIDYYEMLGVSRTADTDEIKHAYRRKARELHPDMSETGDEEQFKLLTRAYEVLGDADNRRSYDMGIDPTEPRGGGFSGFGPGGGFSGFPGFGGFGSPGSSGGATFGFQDIFDTFFGGAGQSRSPVSRKQRGDDILIPTTISLHDAVFGVQKSLEVDADIACETCYGVGAQPGTDLNTCNTCHGSGHVQRVQRSFLGQVMTTALCPDCEGHGNVIAHPCAECHGEGRVPDIHNLTINIPAGVQDGTRVRLPGQGEAGPGGGSAGDLFVQIHVESDPRFERSGDDLLATVDVPMTVAALGTSYRMNTLDGLREVRIEPGTQPGKVIRLPGLGVGHLHGKGRGDLLVTVKVSVPTDLTDAQRALLAQFATDRGEELWGAPGVPDTATPAGGIPSVSSGTPKRKRKTRARK